MSFSWQSILAVLGGTAGFGIAGLGLDLKTSLMSPYVLMPALVANFFGEQIDQMTGSKLSGAGSYLGLALKASVAGFVAAGVIWYTNGAVDLKMGVGGLACALGYTAGEFLGKPSS
jgi:hypothetical protein